MEHSINKANNFISSRDNDEERVSIHNLENIINDEADEVITELCDSFKYRYQNNLKAVKICKFVLD